MIAIFIVISPAVAGNKFYIDDDLEKHRYSSDSKSNEADETNNQGSLDRISYFDITDIDIEIAKLNEDMEKSKKNEWKEISRRCNSTMILPHPRFSDEEVVLKDDASEAACEEAIQSKHEKYRDKLSQHISILKDRQKRLRELYEIQEERERKKYDH